MNVKARDEVVEIKTFSVDLHSNNPISASLSAKVFVLPSLMKSNSQHNTEIGASALLWNMQRLRNRSWICSQMNSNLVCFQLSVSFKQIITIRPNELSTPSFLKPIRSSPPSNYWIKFADLCANSYSTFLYLTGQIVKVPSIGTGLEKSFLNSLPPSWLRSLPVVWTHKGTQRVDWNPWSSSILFPEIQVPW